MNKPNSPMLRWVLERGSARISCEINQNADRTFDLHVVPSWSKRERVINRCPDVIHAMSRHAAVAGMLRDSGWRVVERTTTRRRAAA
jgi:hypothetical protein